MLSSFTALIVSFRSDRSLPFDSFTYVGTLIDKLLQTDLFTLQISQAAQGSTAETGNQIEDTQKLGQQIGAAGGCQTI